MKVKRLSADSKLPTRSYNSNGYDVYAYGNYVISPTDTKIIRTGIAIELNKGEMAFVADRSSLGVKGITTLNELAFIPQELEIVPFAGVIDSDYRGEIGIVLHNFSQDHYRVDHGAKIAQLIIVKTEIRDIEEIFELQETDRGASGYGSSNPVASTTLLETIKRNQKE